MALLQPIVNKGRRLGVKLYSGTNVAFESTSDRTGTIRVEGTNSGIIRYVDLTQEGKHEE